MVDDGGELVGFFNFVPEGHEVRLGLGMRPDLTGRGLAQPFIEAGLEYARREWRPRTFRLWVASWNERALRAYRRAGFHEVRRGEESRFVEMERPRDPRRRRSARGAGLRRRRRRARDDARRARLPARRGRRGRARVGAAGTRGGRGSSNRRRPRRRGARRADRGGARPLRADARKVGPRDLAAAAVQGAVGATTVGGTLAVARAAGIRVLATGGIGGVHRGFPDPPDVSADLAQLARTPALVVSAGVKSLLDVPATAELLESLGVPVLGFRVDTLPLFYGAAGGPPVSARVESAEEAARVAEAHWQLGGAGLLLAGRPTSRSRTSSRSSRRRCAAAAARSERARR